MKKRMRMLTCLLLVALLVASMAIPAVAVANGSGTYNNIDYKWTVTKGQLDGTAYITTPGTGAQVSATAQNRVFYDLESCYGFSEKATTTNFRTTTATADNIIVVKGVKVRGTRIEYTLGSFDVWTTRVVTNVREG